MHALIPSLRDPRTSDPETAEGFRQPAFECHDLPRTVRVEVFVPGVDAAGVEITSHGPDLAIVARKTRLVRTNWRALHLEAVQSDYRLKLRLGHGVDFDRLQAEMREGVLSLVVPKRQIGVMRTSSRCVA